MMNMDYNLDDLDVALSEARHQAAAVSGPPTRNESRRTGHSSTRRGSLLPPKGAISSASQNQGAKQQQEQQQQQHRLDELNLFNFDLRELVSYMFLPIDGQSRVSYHEYAVFAPSEPNGETLSPSIMSDGEEGLQMFRSAIKEGHGLDNEGNFTPMPKGKHLLRGRMRQVIAHRRIRHESECPSMHCTDGLHLTVDDYESLGLHSGTLPTLQRVTLESSFWDSRKETVYLILSFSSSPQPPYDFLSMAYKLKTRTGTALIRRSFDTRWHADDALDEYERRLDSCRARWSHPLVLPVVLLQVQLFRTEEAVQANNAEVLELEAHVDAVTGTTGRANAEAWLRNQSHSNKHHPFKPIKRWGSGLKDMVEEKVRGGRRSHDVSSSAAPSPRPEVNGYFDPEYVPPQTIHLMKEAHDVLKGAIQLLDTLRWMERALKLIIQAGDELDARVTELRAQAVARGQMKEDEEDELTVHWHEIRQYLDCTWRLCTSLETDRRMSELRCRAQIDIIYSKMAQEDNNLNARMAVASTRDSSSMKALAVITAVFLPGEYIGTLFGVSMFDWETGTAGDPAVSNDAPEGWPHPVVMPSFWIYWAFTIPLTLFIVFSWRAWWVNQDRFFRRHLSVDLSNERYWTTDGRPRDLETTFMQDFFSGLLSRSGAGTSSNSTILGKTPRPRSRNGPSPSVDLSRSQIRTPISRPGSSLGLPRQGSGLGHIYGNGAKDRDFTTDSEREGDGTDPRMRFRQITFARGPLIRREGVFAV
ncbi:uncharacterized protein F4807DRAFT_408630 [Annulohypoxylon truncatum]|uniref:uncharacterized protein n=1 Tax=Annulohypoxylon truncatum TaxID=327061 RepID=UPI0020082142|nr:uncharacterized protein F4807DRAFT_408630 [Annulohypoxylon truncatum]KAI1213664.1 hypothetical protein F4807DRAFT_408630 [Annulohypoxylon truncatum]